MEIELINSTPFVPLQFESIDSKLNHFGVVVLRGTFDIRNGERLNLSMEQDSLVLEDQYYGSPESSSLRLDSSLSPYKPKTDVLVEAVAHSPSGRPEESWVSSIEAPNLHKSFRVTGPRNWIRRPLGMQLTEIEPVEKVDVRYENSYGGMRSDRSRMEFNPVGVGYNSGRDAVVRAPQLLPVDVERPVFGQEIAPIGIGPVAPSWQPRLKRGGTLDDHWKETRAPYLPKDFSFEFYNVASEGMSFPGFANGNEIFQLTNLSIERELKIGLPYIQMITMIQLDDGRLFPGPMNLDTIEFRIEERKAFLQWRGIFPAQLATRAIEIRMSAPEYMVEG